MPEYVVYRHGSDAANQGREQGLPQKRPVARVEAGSPEEACRLAARDVTLAAGQHLSAEPAEQVDARVQNLDRPVESLSPGPPHTA